MARDLAGGFSPGCCTILQFAGGRSAFVKAVGAELNPTSFSIHRREARIAAAMPTSPQLARLLGVYDDGARVALAFEEVAGAMPRHPWSESDVRAVLDGLASLHEALTPCPLEDVEPTSVRWRSLVRGWTSLAEMASMPASLDRWAIRHLDSLAELEATCALALDDGDTLVHGDVRSDNVLLREGVAVFVDWPHASKGCSIFDLIAWAPSVALEGGPDPESLLASYRVPVRPSPDAITAMIAGLAGFFTYQATLPPEPALPTLRAFQDAQGAVAQAWLRRRTGWT